MLSFASSGSNCFIYIWPLSTADVGVLMQFIRFVRFSVCSTFEVNNARLETKSIEDLFVDTVSIVPVVKR